MPPGKRRPETRQVAPSTVSTNATAPVPPTRPLVAFLVPPQADAWLKALARWPIMSTDRGILSTAAANAACAAGTSRP